MHRLDVLSKFVYGLRELERTLHMRVEEEEHRSCREDRALSILEAQFISSKTIGFDSEEPGGSWS